MLWFRNTWSWNGEVESTPTLQAIYTDNDLNIIEAIHPTLGKRWLYAQGDGEMLFTENETNNELVFGTPNISPYVKDEINNYVVNGNKDTVNPDRIGTKTAIHYVLSIEPGATQTIQLRLSDVPNLKEPLGDNFNETNGQIPAYEWAFGDVNPPVHAWATWRVYKIEQKLYGKSDRQYSKKIEADVGTNRWTQSIIERDSGAAQRS